MGPWPSREVHGVLQEGAEFSLCCWGNLELCSSSVSGRSDQVPAEEKEQDAFLGTSAISTVGSVGCKSNTDHLCPLLSSPWAPK